MKWLRAIWPIVILALGMAGAVYLVKTRPTPEKKPIEHLGELVETRSTAPVDRAVSLTAHGSVMPARRVVLQPEVSGRITWMNPELVPGGRLKKGDRIIRVDGREYSLAVKQQESSVEQAALQLKLEQMQHQVAKDEWRIIGEDANATTEGRAIALREPQLETAKVQLSAAKSARARAQLSVGRTSMTAPFDAWVQTENVELGQLVGPQSQLVTLVGTDEYWVQVSLPMDSLSFVSIPGLREKTEGSIATVTQGSGDNRVARQGQVVRLLGDLGPAGRMARILVEVKNPLGDGREQLPLLVGAFVKVELQTGELKGVYEIERSSFRDGDAVFIMTAERTLEVRKVEVVWRTPKHVLVRGGLKAGEQLVTSRIATPIQGMKLRTTAATAVKLEPAASQAIPSASAPVAAVPKPESAAPANTTASAAQATQANE